MQSTTSKYSQCMDSQMSLAVSPSTGILFQKTFWVVYGGPTHTPIYQPHLTRVPLTRISSPQIFINVGLSGTDAGLFATGIYGVVSGILFLVRKVLN